MDSITHTYRIRMVASPWFQIANKTADDAFGEWPRATADRMGRVNKQNGTAGAT
jgi:hypothetical protein